MKKIKIIFGVSLLVMLFTINFISCKKVQAAPTTESKLQEPNLPVNTYSYMTKHRVNSELATLGRVLFYDNKLSVNNMVSCGSCHKQEFAFADNVKVNKGFNGIDLKRNSPSIQGIKGFFDMTNNMIFNGSAWVDNPKSGMPDKVNQQKVLLFWDCRQTNLADMVLNPVLNHNEMNMPDFETLIQKLNNTSYYPTLFKNAFGSEIITKENIAYALEGFITCLSPVIATTSTAQINGFMNNNISNTDPTTGNQSTVANVPLTAIEEQGRFLFHNKYNCAKCHDPSQTGNYGSIAIPNFMFNIGLDEVSIDNGLGNITKKPGDQGVFKVPTLNNISVTAPYMHDGRYATLSDVLDHYSHNIKANKNLATQFTNLHGTPKKLNITAPEKQALISFLNTIKDNDFLTSPMYSDPFKK